MERVDKAAPCLVRASSAGSELLVFQHPMAGVQVPKGTVEPGESPEDAALRELREETGIDGARVRERVGTWERIAGAGPDERGPDERHLWHVYWIESRTALPERWTHVVRVAGPEDGLRFECHWLALRAESAERLHPLFHPVFEMVRRAATGA